MLRCDGSPSQIKVTLSPFKWRCSSVRNSMRFAVVRARPHAKDEGGIAAVGPQEDSGRHREALPVEVVGEDGGLALGRPGGSHRGEEAYPALLFEADPGVPGSCIFLPWANVH